MGFGLHFLDFRLIKRLVLFNNLVGLFYDFPFQTHKHRFDFLDGLFDSFLENEFPVIKSFLIEFDILNLFGSLEME